MHTEPPTATWRCSWNWHEGGGDGKRLTRPADTCTVPYAESRNARIHYETEGSGRPLILVTGLAGDTGFWARTVPLLKDSFEVVTLDNRGAGSTSYSGRFSVADMADDVVSVMDGAGIGRADILGWSMGSHIALRAAAGNPSRFSTLTLVSCYLHRPARAAYILDYLASGYARGDVDAATVGRVLNVLLHTPSFFEKAEREGRKIREMKAPDPQGFMYQMHAVDSYDAEKDARSLKVPTLSVHGLEDIMTEPSAGDEIASKIEGCSVLRLPGEGHIIRPENYIPRVKDFILSRRR